MPYQYFVVPQAALSALVGTGTMDVTVFSPGGPEQPAVILTDRPDLLPNVAAPLREVLSADAALFTIPAVFRHDNARQIEALSARIAGEFVQIVDDVQRQPEATSPAPISNEIRQWLLGRLLSQDETATEIVAEARMIIGALEEIRSLHDSDIFASGLIRGMATSLPFLGSDYADFARMLFEELLSYSKKRDEAEANFLQPYLDSLTELKELLHHILGFGPKFSQVNISGRIKEGILAKLMRRGWKDMKLFYDLAGLRVVVGSETEVEAAVYLISEALSQGIFEDEQTGGKHRYGIAHRDPKRYESGYHAVHLDLFLEKMDSDGKGLSTSPVAEIQIMTRGNYLWGEIQRNLVYKSEAEGIPEAVRTAFDSFCRESAVFIRACESGTERPYRPRIDRGYVESIPDSQQRAYFKSEVERMYKLVAKAAALDR